MFSLQGQLIKKISVHTSTGKINLQTLTAGIYLVKLTNLSEQATIKRLIIQ
ncbi:T9SS type A sorting domain-containing protein [Mesonia mobilis]|uniref:T9SS type A sorting domain-containing protein n=1 Tax=Mesonia mobilis TaxID=369791 RepID=UPI0021D3398E|nr:T9SS type A sorting domain-containing protein [Mesonia mobilis]